MIEIIAIVVVLIIIGIIRDLVETRGKKEVSLLNQPVRISEMKMADTATERGVAEVASKAKSENIENDDNMESSDNSVDGKSQEETVKENTRVNDNTEETLIVMQGILSELGCQPKKENDHELTVTYQGENFIVKTGGYYAQIWDPGWANINVNDANFEKMKTAANISNFDFGPSIVWSSPNEDGMVSLHSKRDVLLHPDIPDKNGYIRSIFESFFEKKESMRGHFNALINQKQQSPKPLRPVGFATTEE